MSNQTVPVDLRYTRSPDMTPLDEQRAEAFGLIGSWVKVDCELRDGAIIAPHAPFHLGYSAAVVDGKSIEMVDEESDDKSLHGHGQRLRG